jgi:hypothetical protein
MTSTMFLVCSLLHHDNFILVVRLLNSLPVVIYAVSCEVLCTRYGEYGDFFFLVLWRHSPISGLGLPYQASPFHA